MVKILIKTESRYPVNRKAIRKGINDVLTAEGLTNLDAEVSVLVCGSRKMKMLADKHVGDKKVHEVLSFPFEDPKKIKMFVNSSDEVMILGDIIVSWPEVIRLASVNDRMVDDELAFLVGHGMEHLLGKHHDEN
jgi:rRNA maturation RNase YbeY